MCISWCIVALQTKYFAFSFIYFTYIYLLSDICFHYFYFTLQISTKPYMFSMLVEKVLISFFQIDFSIKNSLLHQVALFFNFRPERLGSSLNPASLIKRRWIKLLLNDAIFLNMNFFHRFLVQLMPIVPRHGSKGVISGRSFFALHPTNASMTSLAKKANLPLRAFFIAWKRVCFLKMVR